MTTRYILSFHWLKVSPFRQRSQGSDALCGGDGVDIKRWIDGKISNWLLQTGLTPQYRDSKSLN